jgi:hypothetical protein
VAGDEVGATLFRKQAEMFAKKPPTRDELVALLAEKVAEGGEDENGLPESEQAETCKCGSVYCDICGKEYWDSYAC